jgi:hypothetical protein
VGSIQNVQKIICFTKGERKNAKKQKVEWHEKETKRSKE